MFVGGLCNSRPELCIDTGIECFVPPRQRVAGRDPRDLRPFQSRTEFSDLESLEMVLRRAIALTAVVFTFGLVGCAQEAPMPQLTPGEARRPQAKREGEAPRMIELHLPKGTPMQIMLPDEVHVKKVGQPIYGRIVEPVYAFDQIVVPAGSEVTGKIVDLEHLSGKKRTLAALDADFTPARELQVEFDEVMLADGRHFPVQTSVTEGSGQVLQFVISPDEKKKDKASEKAKEAKQRAKQQWDQTMQQVKAPGRVRRAERFVQKLMPVHPQYIQPGTVYFAELNEPLEFGSKPMTPEMAERIGAEIPRGALVRARLLTPLNSATTQRGAEVEAVVSRPVFDGTHLILPQGSRLKGSVLQVAPARLMKKNGQLRIAFHELVPPEGIEQKVEATLAGVQAGKDGNVKLDAEGGAEATTSNKRYLKTAFSLALAAASAHTDEDGGAGGTTPGARAAGGVNGFKLVGMTLGLLVHSRAFGYSMGAYGAANSIYSNFIARGQEVIFPKDTAMEVALAARTESLSSRTADAIGLLADSH